MIIPQGTGQLVQLVSLNNQLVCKRKCVLKIPAILIVHVYAHTLIQSVSLNPEASGTKKRWWTSKFINN